MTGEGSAFRPEEKDLLLRLAREAVEARVRRLPSPETAGVPPALQELGAAFVSLHLGEDLRGCVGYAEPHWPLADTVVRAGGAAAGDRRFPPLSAAELPGLAIEISILSPLVSIDPAAVEVGVHGLVLRGDGGSGLLLPQVPVEQGWDREQFLDSLCRKAGLRVRAWQEPAAELFAFTTERIR